MNSSINRRLGYEDIFDGNPKDFEDYFEGMGKEDIFKAITFLVNAANPDHELFSADKLIEKWFCPANQGIKNEILAKISPSEGIAHIISSLKLVEYVLTHFFDEATSISDEDLEINLLKAYSLLNVEQKKNEEDGYKYLPPESDAEERFIALIVTMGFHDSDLMNYKIADVLIPQIVKSIEFFKYLERRKELNPHLEYFLEMFDCDSWQTWLKNYLAVVLPNVASEPKSFYDIVVVHDDNYERNCAFWDTLILSDEDSHSMKDFITLRSQPLIKIGEGHYRVIFTLFLVEKIFKSIQFLFSLKINREIPKQFQLKDFRADHCDLFSEQTLLYRVIEKSFPSYWVQKSGEDFRAFGYEGEPDYYVRCTSKIFLFESKDVVLKGDEKQSRNWDILNKALCEKFYKITKSNGKIEAKAVLQIIENIKRLFERYYSKCDGYYNPELIVIYPILITHDRQFDAMGVQRLVNSWFMKELENIKDKVDIDRIKPLTLINIDTFLTHQEFLTAREQVKIEDIIDEYHAMINFDKSSCRDYEELTQKTMDSYMSFSHFFEGRIDNLGVRKMPSFVLEYAKGLFE
ncbi:MAG: hypothetical protein DHS20C13_22150 [Thermodesulfobacteriota bacterium]|nr:MAG: hypothetical protein DHS20C13_22150 [Thermodesulfobacteriota bacterium]GJM35912.1 MAG: hypothetical protein DHS20C18_49130 [Saprospiraceae bacterium]